MELKQGYKQTEVGVIPQDWEIKTFSEVFNVTAGGDVDPTKTSSFKDEIHRYPIYSNAITNRGLYGFCSYADHQAGSITVTARGTLGVANFRDHEFTAIGRVLVLHPKEEIDGHFFSEVINSRIKFAIESTGVPQLTAPQISNYKLPVPPLHEQRAIASVLSDVDALLAKLEALIAKKRNIKKAAMQQLLTGKKRLPGFGDGKQGYKQTELGPIPLDWELKKFSDVITGFSSGATPYRGKPEYYKGNIRWITSGELNYNIIYDSVEKITAEAVKNTNLKIHPKGTFLIAITGLEAEGTRGSCGILGVESTTNQSCMALFPTEELLTEYLFHFYVNYGDYLAKVYCQGTKQQSYTANIVKILPIIVPPLPEQRAIASVLSDMDAEISALENRLKKTRALKEGMMQELLTGRIRLI